MKDNTWLWIGIAVAVGWWWWQQSQRPPATAPTTTAAEPPAPTSPAAIAPEAALRAPTQSVPAPPVPPAPASGELLRPALPPQAVEFFTRPPG